MRHSNTPLAQQLQGLSEHFQVPDLLTPQTQLVFLLESPHVQELKYGAPVSGPSGATMTKHLFGDEYAKFPLGRLLIHNLDNQVHRPRLDALGLMNVCNVPMQGSAYGPSPIREEHKDMITALEYIRSNNQRDVYSETLYNEVQQVILGDLQKRLEALRQRSITFVPCGRFAQKFYRLADVSSPHWNTIHDVPHPSYNSWDRARYAVPVAQVQQAFAKL